MRRPTPLAGEQCETSLRELLIDGLPIIVVSVAICVFSQQLLLMSVLVVLVALLRQLLRSTLQRGLPWTREAALFSLCTVLGAGNDWNSVTRHAIYRYDVPVAFPELSQLPLWMLLYWGLILRFMVTLFRFRGLKLGMPNNRVVVGGRAFDSAGLRVGFLLALVVATRQAIYRTFDHSIWSWLPFALALILALVVTRPDRRRLWMLAAVAVLGPAVEAAYIQLGQLHHYALGWFAGVPLWIVLWWILAALIWEDLSARLLRVLSGVHSAPGYASPPPPLPASRQ